MEKILDEIWKKIQYPKRGFEKLAILSILQNPKNPRGGLNLDQILSYCTFIQILTRSLQYANMITFHFHADSNLIL